MDFRSQVRRPRVAATLGFAALLLLGAVAERWLGLNVDAVIQETKTDRVFVTAMSDWKLWLAVAVEHLTGPFAIGFLIGAILFALPDVPVVAEWIRRTRARHRNKKADMRLAQEFDEIGKLLYDESASVSRLQAERHWQTDMRSGDPDKQWREARMSESREIERVRKRIGARLIAALNEFQTRDTNLDLWGLSIDTYSLSSAAAFCSSIAIALKNGDYHGRTFKVDRTIHQL